MSEIPNFAVDGAQLGLLEMVMGGVTEVGCLGKDLVKGHTRTAETRVDNEKKKKK